MNFREKKWASESETKRLYHHNEICYINGLPVAGIVYKVIDLGELYEIFDAPILWRDQ